MLVLSVVRNSNATSILHHEPARNLKSGQNCADIRHNPQRLRNKRSPFACGLNPAKAAKRRITRNRRPKRLHQHALRSRSLRTIRSVGGIRTQRHCMTRRIRTTCGSKWNEAMPDLSGKGTHASCCAHGAMLLTLLVLCVSSLRKNHANLHCIVPMLTGDPRRPPCYSKSVNQPA